MRITVRITVQRSEFEEDSLAAYRDIEIDLPDGAAIDLDELFPGRIHIAALTEDSVRSAIMEWFSAANPVETDEKAEGGAA